MDGHGYPDGLRGERIPIAAQVVALADVYNALTSERCYKKAFDHDTAIAMILGGECGAFNPLLLECLADVSPRLRITSHVPLDGDPYRLEVNRLSDELLARPICRGMTGCSGYWSPCRSASTSSRPVAAGSSLSSMRFPVWRTCAV